MFIKVWKLDSESWQLSSGMTFFVISEKMQNGQVKIVSVCGVRYDVLIHARIMNAAQDHLLTRTRPVLSGTHGRDGQKLALQGGDR